MIILFVSVQVPVSLVHMIESATVRKYLSALHDSLPPGRSTDYASVAYNWLPPSTSAPRTGFRVRFGFRSFPCATALLRLATEKICTALEPTGKDINAKIGVLVQNGLRAEIQQALDTVRVVGNNAVHPGQMDLKDDRDTCVKLFGLVNIIVEDRISQPKAIQELFAKLPDTAKDAIDKRDQTDLIRAA